jgi:cysteine sulfinate desulfinase/cysteine desulfurase-like protein
MVSLKKKQPVGSTTKSMNRNLTIKNKKPPVYRSSMKKKSPETSNKKSIKVKKSTGKLCNSKSTNRTEKKSPDMLYFDDQPILCAMAEKNYKDYMKPSPNSDKVIKECKEHILKVCNGINYSVFFTSGETESNSIIMCCAINAYKKLRKAKPHIIISAIEHNSIIKYAKSMEDSDQVELTIIQPNIYGCILSDNIEKHIKPNTCLVSIMYVNHELGSVNNITKIGEFLHSKHIPLHSDCTHLFGKHTLDIKKSNIDAATISFDAIHGSTDSGALIINDDFFAGYKLDEHSTTLSGSRPKNIPAVASALAAVKCSLTNRKKKNAKLLKLRKDLIEKLGKFCQILNYANFLKSDDPPLEGEEKTKIIVLGPPLDNESYYVPGILSMSVLSKKKVNLQKELEKKKIMIRSGYGDDEHVYDAITAPQEVKDAVIHITISDTTSPANVDKLAKCMQKILE